MWFLADLLLALVTGLCGALIFQFVLPTGDNTPSLFMSAGFGILGFCFAMVLSPLQSRMHRVAARDDGHPDLR